MAYRLLYSGTSAKDIRKLDKAAQKKLKRKIEEYSKNPIKSSRKLIDPKIGTYGWRAGNYRIIFDVKGKDIIILRVGHRREICKW